MTTLIFLYLITIVVSYFLIREAVKKQILIGALQLEEVIILVVSVLIPVFNIVISTKNLIELNKNPNSRLSTIIENFFMIKH